MVILYTNYEVMVIVIAHNLFPTVGAADRISRTMRFGTFSQTGMTSRMKFYCVQNERQEETTRPTSSLKFHGSR